MPYKHPGTGQEFQTIPEQWESLGCGSLIMKGFSLLIGVGSGLQAYMMYVQGIRSSGEWLLFGFLALLCIAGIKYVFQKGR